MHSSEDRVDQEEEEEEEEEEEQTNDERRINIYISISYQEPCSSYQFFWGTPVGFMFGTIGGGRRVQ